MPTVISVTNWFLPPPSTLYSGWPIALPRRSYSAMSTAALAAVLPAIRPSIMRCAPSMSSASRPMSPCRNSLSTSSTVPAFSPVTGSKGAASPMPHRPSSVMILTSTLTEWSCTANAMRNGFFSGICTTSVFTSVIFIQQPSRWMRSGEAPCRAFFLIVLRSLGAVNGFGACFGKKVRGKSKISAAETRTGRLYAGTAPRRGTTPGPPPVRERRATRPRRRRPAGKNREIIQTV